jgi:hypothetical protein
MRYRVPWPYVEVIWEDAVAHNESWVDIKNENVDTELVITRGWLVKEKEGYVSIASSVAGEKSGEDQVGNVASIPRGMIKSMRNISVVKARAKKDVC